MTTPPAITARSVHKSFGLIDALAGIELEIESGQIFGLIGPNGAGKTTLIRTLVGALQPDSGEVAVLGLDPLAHRREVRARLGYMPQDPALYEDLSASVNVRFFAAAHVPDPAQRAAASLAFVGLADRADDPVYTLSGGMRQRVSLACALAHEPVLPEILEAYGLQQLEFGPRYIIPKPFDPRLMDFVPPAIARAAVDSGVARIDLPPKYRATANR